VLPSALAACETSTVRHLVRSSRGRPSVGRQGGVTVLGVAGLARGPGQVGRSTASVATLRVTRTDVAAARGFEVLAVRW
jgi:hypothetical protein